MFRAAVITLSDKGAAGQREDKSGPLIKEMLAQSGYIEVVRTELIGDEPQELTALLQRFSDEEKYDLVLTTGGTGLSPRDQTPEATLAAADRLVPGIAEYMRYRSFAITPRAMLSRGVCVMRKQTLIINLPGSPKAVRENLGFILPALQHGLEIMTGRAGDCGAEDRAASGSRHRTEDREVSFLDGEGSRRLAAGKDERALCQQRFHADITLADLDFSQLAAGDVIEYGGEKFVLTQTGKRCFAECRLYREEGPCFLARHCAFGRRT